MLRKIFGHKDKHKNPKEEAAAAPKVDLEVPDYLTCIITSEIFNEPVVVSPSGKKYEWEALVKLIATDINEGQTPTCPKTREPIVSYVKCTDTVELVNDYLKAHPEAKQHQYVKKNPVPAPSAPVYLNLQANAPQVAAAPAPSAPPLNAESEKPAPEVHKKPKDPDADDMLAIQAAQAELDHTNNQAAQSNDNDNNQPAAAAPAAPVKRRHSFHLFRRHHKPEAAPAPAPVVHVQPDLEDHEFHLFGRRRHDNPVVIEVAPGHVMGDTIFPHDAEFARMRANMDRDMADMRARNEAAFNTPFFTRGRSFSNPTSGSFSMGPSFSSSSAGSFSMGPRF